MFRIKSNNNTNNQVTQSKWPITDGFLIVHKQFYMKKFVVDQVYDLNSPNMADVKMARVKMSEQELKSVIEKFSISDINKDLRPDVMTSAKHGFEIGLELEDANSGELIATLEQSSDYYLLLGDDDKLIGMKEYAKLNPDNTLPPYRVTLVEFENVDIFKKVFFLSNVKNIKKLPKKIASVYLSQVESLVIQRYLVYLEAGYADNAAQKLVSPESFSEDDVEYALANLGGEISEKFANTDYMDRMTLVYDEVLKCFAPNGKIVPILKCNILWEWISKKLVVATSQDEEAKKLAKLFKQMLASDAKSIESAKTDRAHKKSEEINAILDNLYEELK